MTRALPKEEREKIVQAYKNGLGSVPTLAKIFNITARAIYNYLRLDRESGDLTPDTQPGRPPILTDENLSIIKKIVLSHPDGTLEEYRVQFYKKTGVEVTIVTIHNACKELNLRRKKRVFLPRNKKGKTLSKNEQILSNR